MENTKNTAAETAQDYAEIIAREVRDAFINGTMGEVAEAIMEVKTIKNSYDEVCGVKLTRTIGGPTCWIDTDDQIVYCSWGGEFGHCGLWSDECAELEEYFILD